MKPIGPADSRPRAPASTGGSSCEASCGGRVRPPENQTPRAPRRFTAPSASEYRGEQLRSKLRGAGTPPRNPIPRAHRRSTAPSAASTGGSSCEASCGGRVRPPETQSHVAPRRFHGPAPLELQWMMRRPSSGTGGAGRGAPGQCPAARATFPCSSGRRAAPRDCRGRGAGSRAPAASPG